MTFSTISRIGKLPEWAHLSLTTSVPSSPSGSRTPSDSSQFQDRDRYEARPPRELKSPTNHALQGLDLPISPSEIASVLGASRVKVEANWPHLARACIESGVTERNSLLALVAISVRESGMEPIIERYGGQAYEGRADLGNIHPGDGARYRGRGFIQLTGRSNYAHYGKQLGVPLEAHPELALRPDIAARVAVAYWKDRGILPLANRGDWRALNRKVAGDDTGYEVMMSHVARLKAAIAGM